MRETLQCMSAFVAHIDASMLCTYMCCVLLCMCVATIAANLANRSLHAFVYCGHYSNFKHNIIASICVLRPPITAILAKDHCFQCVKKLMVVLKSILDECYADAIGRNVSSRKGLELVELEADDKGYNKCTQASVTRHHEFCNKVLDSFATCPRTTTIRSALQDIDDGLQGRVSNQTTKMGKSVFYRTEAEKIHMLLQKAYKVVRSPRTSHTPEITKLRRSNSHRAMSSTTIVQSVDENSEVEAVEAQPLADKKDDDDVPYPADYAYDVCGSETDDDEHIFDDAATPVESISASPEDTSDHAAAASSTAPQATKKMRVETKPPVLIIPDSPPPFLQEVIKNTTGVVPDYEAHKQHQRELKAAAGAAKAKAKAAKAAQLPSKEAKPSKHLRPSQSQEPSAAVANKDIREPKVHYKTEQGRGFWQITACNAEGRRYSVMCLSDKHFGGKDQAKEAVDFFMAMIRDGHTKADLEATKASRKKYITSTKLHYK